jgi:hypothetical protein
MTTCGIVWWYWGKYEIGDQNSAEASRKAMICDGVQHGENGGVGSNAMVEMKSQFVQ